MPYGFLDVVAGARQKDGFFIDEDNRILFWPTREEPGYVLDETTALLITSGNLHWRGLAEFIGGLVAILGLPYLAAALYPYLNGRFSTTGTYTLTILGFGAICLAMVPVYRRLRAAAIRSGVLSQRQYAVVAFRRPSHLTLKPSETMGRKRFVLGVVLLFVATTAMGAMGYFYATPPGDYAATGMFTAAMAGWLLLMVWNQIRGIRISETFLYRPPMPPSSPSLSQPTSGQRPFRRFSSWAFSGWRVWVLVAAGAPALGIGIAKFFYEARLTPDELLSQYRRSAFLSQDDIVVKWTGPVTVCIGSGLEGDLRGGIRSAIANVAEAARLSVDFRETDCAIEIVFLDGSRKNAEGKSGAIGGKFDQVDGVMKRSRIEISPVSLGALAPGVMFGGRNARQDLVRNVSNTVALWSIGFKDSPNFDPIYVDRRGNRVMISQALASLHYDKRIRVGASVEEAMTQAKDIAEIVLSRSRPNIKRQDKARQ